MIDNNDKRLNFTTTLKIKLKSPKKSFEFNSSKKEVKFLGKLNQINFSELYNSNSFQNSNLDLLNNSFSLNIAKNDNKNKERESFYQESKSLIDKKSDIGNITIIKGFDYFGGKDLFKELDRKKAIELAIKSAKKGDLVLLLGKGHEKTILRADGAHPFEDIKIAEKALRSLGYHK